MLGLFVAGCNNDDDGGGGGGTPSTPSSFKVAYNLEITQGLNAGKKFAGETTTDVSSFHYAAAANGFESYQLLFKPDAESAFWSVIYLDNNGVAQPLGDDPDDGSWISFGYPHNGQLEAQKTVSGSCTMENLQLFPIQNVSELKGYAAYTLKFNGTFAKSITESIDLKGELTVTPVY